MAAGWLCVLCLTVLCLHSLCGIPGALSSKIKTRSSAVGAKFSGTVHFNNPKLLNEKLRTSNGFVYDTRQGSVDPRKLGGIHIQWEAHRLMQRLRDLSNEEMLVPELQTVYDTLSYRNVTQYTRDTVRELAEDIKEKMDNKIRMLQINKQTVEHLYMSHMRRPITARRECCSLPHKELHYDNTFQCDISTKYSCDLIPPSVPKGVFNPGRNLTEVFQQAAKIVPGIKWQYFISAQGVHTEFPAHNFQNSAVENCHNAHDTRHRDIYVSTVHPASKHIVIMVDHGNSLSVNQLRLAKAVARHILASLTENDWVGLFGLSSEVEYPRHDNCVNKTLVRFTQENKAQFTHFLDGLQKKELPVDHTMGFQKAFDLIGNSSIQTDTSKEAMIIYISRGLMSSLRDSKDVLEAIQTRNQRLGNRVVINTFAVIDDGKPIMYEKNFMENIADQKLSGRDSNTNRMVKSGLMRAVNSTTDLSSVIGDFYTPLNHTIADVPRMFLPQHDEAANGVVLSLTWPCFYEKDLLLGIVGLDIYLSEILEKLTYFNREHGAYTFLLSTEGYTLSHPSLIRPALAKEPPVWTDVSHYETVRGFSTVRHNILRQEEGEQSLTMVKPPDYGVPQSGDRANVYKIKYIWQRVKRTDFIVVMKVVQDKKLHQQLQNVQAPGSSSLRYHRLDLVPTDNMCMHLKQLATLETSTVYMTAQAFSNPFGHLSQIENKHMVLGYMAYLNDKTTYIRNTAFKDGVRNDVAALAQMHDKWRERARSSSRRWYIVRRFAGTPSGAFSMYPGTLIDKKYDHTKRHWFSRSWHYPGRVTLTAPYLDVGGAGYIVTVSHTVYQKTSTILHTQSDPLAGVVGLDVTLGYFYKQLLEILPVCGERHIRCFIMDDRGYLVAHRDLIEPNGKGPVEQEHITHKEPQVAHDILNHQGFVKKKLCNSYSDRTVQRFYQFNTSFDGILTNLIHGEHCHKYQVTAIPGTNSFLGIVNETCTMMRAFCPCSMVDRLCLNCHRMEQTECECPCECPLEMDYCNGKLLRQEDKNPNCNLYPEPMQAVLMDKEVSDSLPQCLPTRCQDFKSKMACMGVVDCEWCVYDTDGSTFLRHPFCGTQRRCFAGVLGEKTPYDDQIPAVSAAQNGEQEYIRSTPVGPVAGGIMGCFLVLALAVYCYRHHVHRQSHQYITAAPENGNCSPIEKDLDELDAMDDLGSAGHTNIMLPTFDNPASISPYRVNTTYRRPTGGGESDHGYSTMTPHDDSEQASTACQEPLLISRDRYRPTVPSIKGNPIIPPPPSRRSRSPTPPQTRVVQYTAIPEQTTLLPEVPPGMTVIEPSYQGQTIIDPPPHNVIANVQVHMVDSH